jgi:hypothetical protein
LTANNKSGFGSDGQTYHGTGANATKSGGSAEFRLERLERLDNLGKLG